MLGKLNGLIGCEEIGLGILRTVDLPGDEVPKEGQHHMGNSEVLLQQARQSQHTLEELRGPRLGYLKVELVEAADLGRKDPFLKMPITCEDHKGALVDRGIAHLGGDTKTLRVSVDEPERRFEVTFRLLKLVENGVM